jgi:hypothetical protein
MTNRRRYITDNLLRGSYQNIEDLYLGAVPTSHIDGENWYPTANLIATKVGDGDTKKGAGILAVLSPQKDWDVNIGLAFELVATGWATGQTKDNNNKALAILGGVDPDTMLLGSKGKGGAKVSSFYNAILYPTWDNIPVVDRHAQAVYYGKVPTAYEVGRVFGSPRTMRRVQGSYIKVAKKYNVPYNVVQAVTWVQHRIDKGIAKPAIVE